jgi:hypothetical protein
MFFVKKAYTRNYKLKFKKYIERGKKNRKKSISLFCSIIYTSLLYIILLLIIILILTILLALNIKHTTLQKHAKTSIKIEIEEINYNKNSQKKDSILRFYDKIAKNSKTQIKKTITPDFASRKTTKSNTAITITNNSKQNNHDPHTNNYLQGKWKFIKLFLSLFIILLWPNTMNLVTNSSNNDPSQDQIKPLELKIKKETLDLIFKPYEPGPAVLNEFLTPIRKTKEKNENATNNKGKNYHRDKTKTIKSLKKTRKPRKDKNKKRGPNKRSLIKKLEKINANKELELEQQAIFRHHKNLYEKQIDTNFEHQIVFTQQSNVHQAENSAENSAENYSGIFSNLDLLFDQELTNDIEKLTKSNKKPTIMPKNNAEVKSTFEPPRSSQNPISSSSHKANTNISLFNDSTTNSNNIKDHAFENPSINNQFEGSKNHQSCRNDHNSSRNNNINHLNDQTLEDTSENGKDRIKKRKMYNKSPQANHDESFDQNRYTNNRNEDDTDSEKDKEIPLFVPKKKKDLFNNLTPTSKAAAEKNVKKGDTVKIVFTTDKYKNKLDENDQNLSNYIYKNCKIKEYAIDAKGNLLLFPVDNYATDDIIKNQNFFPDEIKINLGREKNPIIISNISIEALDRCPKLQNSLEKIGIIGYDKVSKNHNDDVGIIKAFCDSKEKRLEILSRESLRVTTSDWRYLLEFKPLLWTPERCKYCNVMKHLHQQKECTEHDRKCAKCDKNDHETNQCKVHYSKLKCSNCDYNNNRHSALDTRRCKAYNKWKQNATAKEMKRLREEIGQSANSYPSDPNARSFANVAGVKDEISDIKKKVNNLENGSLINRIIKENNDNLLVNIRKIVASENDKIGEKIENATNKKILEFRSIMRMELIEKQKESEYKITQNVLTLIGKQNLLNIKPPELNDFDKLYEEKFSNKAQSFEEYAGDGMESST